MFRGSSRYSGYAETLFMCWPSKAPPRVVVCLALLRNLLLLLGRPITGAFAFKYEPLLVLPCLPDRSVDDPQSYSTSSSPMPTTAARAGQKGEEIGEGFVVLDPSVLMVVDRDSLT